MSAKPTKRIVGAGAKSTQPEKEKKCQIGVDSINDEFIIKSPYTDWDPEKLCMDPPVSKKAPTNDKIEFDTCDLGYNFGTKEKPNRKDLVIEAPFVNVQDNVIKSTVASPYGIRLKKEKEDDKKKGKKSKKDDEEKKERFHLITQLDGTDALHIAFITLMNDIYNFILRKMEQLYKGTSKEETYAIPDQTRIYTGLSEHSALRYPLMYKKDPKTKKVIPGCISPTALLGVSRWGTSFVSIPDKDGNFKKYPFNDVFERGFEHIPLIKLPQVFLDGKNNQIRTQCLSTIVTKFLNSRAILQDESLKKLMQAGASTQEQARKLADAMMEGVTDNVVITSSSVPETPLPTETPSSTETTPVETAKAEEEEASKSEGDRKEFSNDDSASNPPSGSSSSSSSVEEDKKKKSKKAKKETKTKPETKKKKSSKKKESSDSDSD